MSLEKGLVLPLIVLTKAHEFGSDISAINGEDDWMLRSLVCDVSRVDAQKSWL